MNRRSDLADLIGVPAFVRRNQFDPLVHREHTEEPVLRGDRSQRQTVSGTHGGTHVLARTIELRPRHAGLDVASREDDIACRTSIGPVLQRAHDVGSEGIAWLALGTETGSFGLGDCGRDAFGEEAVDFDQVLEHLCDRPALARWSSPTKAFRHLIDGGFQNGAGIVEERKHLLKVSMHPPIIPSEAPPHTASLVAASIGPLRGRGSG